jgi:hypothetical protein
MGWVTQPLLVQKMVGQTFLSVVLLRNSSRKARWANLFKELKESLSKEIPLFA